jgi:hypothetical protein
MSEGRGSKEYYTIRIKRNNWMFSTIALAIVLIIVLAYAFSGGFAQQSQSMSASQVSQKVVKYINDNLVQAGSTASLVSITDTGSVYKVTVLYQGKNVTVYSSKDGGLVFTSIYNTSINVNNNTVANQTYPKTSVPTVALYVMSFCPYGIQAEKALSPVMAILGPYVNFSLHFIVSVNGTTVSSLHGSAEAIEDMRQACIVKYYNISVLWDYLDYVGNNCTVGNINSTWEIAAAQAGINTTFISERVVAEGLQLMQAEANLTHSKGITASPTMEINGVRYTGARTADAMKLSICSAFTNPPVNCSTCFSCMNP